MQVNYFISLAATLLIAILIYYFLGLKFKKGSSGALLFIFVLGFVSIVLNVLSIYASDFAGLFPLGNSIKRVAFYSLVTAGLTRELGKFIILRLVAIKRKDFNTPADGIVFALMASLGFTTAALLWNITFYQDSTDQLLRSILTLPANLITAIILGFFLGLGKLRKNRFIDSMTGLLAATLFHAVFEFCMITTDTNLIMVVFTGSLIIAAILIVKAINLSSSR